MHPQWTPASMCTALSKSPRKGTRICDRRRFSFFHHNFQSWNIQNKKSLLHIVSVNMEPKNAVFIYSSTTDEKIVCLQTLWSSGTQRRTHGLLSPPCSPPHQEQQSGGRLWAGPEKTLCTPSTLSDLDTKNKTKHKNIHFYLCSFNKRQKPYFSELDTINRQVTRWWLFKIKCHLKKIKRDGKDYAGLKRANHLFFCLLFVENNNFRHTCQHISKLATNL